MFKSFIHGSAISDVIAATIRCDNRIVKHHTTLHNNFAFEGDMPLVMCCDKCNKKSRETELCLEQWLKKQASIAIGSNGSSTIGARPLERLHGSTAWTRPPCRA